MTKAKTKTKKIILLVVATLLVLLILLGCVILWVPGFWHPIDFFPQYQGILDSPIEEIKLWYVGQEVTFSDEDLIDQWEQGLKQLKLRKVYTLITVLPVTPGGVYHQVDLFTQQGRYTIMAWDDQVHMGCFYFDFNNPDYFPFEETFDLAVERHGLDDPG